MKVCITGAAGGLGEALVRLHLMQGDTVFALYRRGKGALGALEASYPQRLTTAACDIADTAETERACAVLRGQTDRLDVLYNCAGISPAEHRVPLEKTDFNACLAIFNCNALGALRVVKGCLPLLGPGSAVINVSSEAGSIGQCARAGEYGYCMSKAALNMATRLLANEAAKRGAGATAVHPGWMHTPMGGPEAPVAPEDAARGIAALALEVKTGARTGLFFDYQGNPLPW